jgi:hypothetical protein
MRSQKAQRGTQKAQKKAKSFYVILCLFVARRYFDVC